MSFMHISIIFEYYSGTWKQTSEILSIHEVRKVLHDITNGKLFFWLYLIFNIESRFVDYTILLSRVFSFVVKYKISTNCFSTLKLVTTSKTLTRNYLPSSFIWIKFSINWDDILIEQFSCSQTKHCKKHLNE